MHKQLKINKMSGLIIVLVILCAVCVESQSVFCCKPGYFMYKGRNRTNTCWDPISNTNASVQITCEKNVLLIEDDMYKFSVNDEKYLVISMPNFQSALEPQTFCVGNYSLSTNTSSLLKAKKAAIICEDEEENEIVDQSALAYCMLVSVIFLTLTAIIYIALPEIRDLNGKSIICFCISLALGLLCLAIMNLISSYSDMNLCATRGFLTYYFFIASFFWTNAISIQILRNMRRPLTVDYGWKEFSWYALYAWGASAAITIAMAIVNFIPGDHQKPGIGLNHCWFFDKKQQWYYMYSVMSILISANICIFVYTSVVLWRQSFASTHLKALKYKFMMTVRLFIIMGVPWIFEMISSISDKHIIWVILDFVNVLQGPLIFLVLVVLRRRVVKALLRRGVLDCLAPHVERHLALADDDEDVIQHTMDVPMDEKVTIT
ncbi:PREDICTED: G-protein coupled receptor Mth2-like [Papilio polytes]|uniref:G-protein coupled receptor Mth2-like n=1 Tax=Papilio polytes TaxID=76194 RepID=UPI0006762E14|nr:PREDICTED: G-protein coupled receptor Mth2-like [Papilio polytes]